MMHFDKFAEFTEKHECWIYYFGVYTLIGRMQQ